MNRPTKCVGNTDFNSAVTERFVGGKS